VDVEPALALLEAALELRPEPRVGHRLRPAQHRGLAVRHPRLVERRRVPAVPLASGHA